MGSPPPMSPVRNRFFHPSQVGNVAKFVSRLGMVDDVEVFRRTPVTSNDPATDYGDDTLAFVMTNDAKRHWVKGWLFSMPAQQQEVDSGAIVTVNTYALRVPVGTDIEPGDEVRINGETYTVSSTNAENTWLPLVNCNLRKRE